MLAESAAPQASQTCGSDGCMVRRRTTVATFSPYGRSAVFAVGFYPQALVALGRWLLKPSLDGGWLLVLTVESRFAVRAMIRAHAPCSLRAASK